MRLRLHCVCPCVCACVRVCVRVRALLLILVLCCGFGLDGGDRVRQIACGKYVGHLRVFIYGDEDDLPRAHCMRGVDNAVRSGACIRRALRRLWIQRRAVAENGCVIVQLNLAIGKEGMQPDGARSARALDGFPDGKRVGCERVRVCGAGCGRGIGDHQYARVRDAAAFV